MVTASIGGVTTRYVGGYFEWRAEGALSESTKYYSAGSARVAMRQMGVVTYLFGDHLGSTSVAYDDAADTTRRQGYTAFGTERYRLGGDLPTRYQYTGQRGFEEIGLQYYGARWYDGALGRFSQADTVIPEPGNPMAWDRFSYTLNNPIRFSDPSGHKACEEGEDGKCENGKSDSLEGIYIPTVSTLPTPNAGATIGNNSPQLAPNTFTEDTGVDVLQRLKAIWKLVGSGKTIDEALSWLINNGRPTYKHVKGLGSVISSPMEAAIGAFLQFLSDTPNSNLNLNQKLARALVVGGEDYVIDLVSNMVAAQSGKIGIKIGGGPSSAGGPIAGILFYIMGSYATNEALNVVAEHVNQKFLPAYFPNEDQ